MNKPKSASFKDISSFSNTTKDESKVGTPSVEAKAPVDAKTNVGTPSVEATAKADDKSKAPKKSKRKSASDWDIILDDIESGNVDIAGASVKYGVATSNIYQQRTKRKQALEQKEVASLSSNSLVDDAKKLIAGIDKELEDFDKDIEAAKAKVASAKDERAKIEAKTKKYQTIIDMFTEEEAKK